MTLPESSPVYVPEEAAFAAAVAALLVQKEAETIGQLLGRPRGLQHFLANKEISAFLTRPFEAVVVDATRQPVLAAREAEFYAACEALGKEIPYRTNRVVTPEEQAEEENARQARAGRPLAPSSGMKPQGIYSRRNTPYIDQRSAAHLEQQKYAVVSKRSEQAMEPYIIHAGSMETAVQQLEAQVAATPIEQLDKRRLYLIVAPHIPPEEVWKGHSLAAAFIYTPQSGRKVAQCFIADPLPIHATLDTGADRIPLELLRMGKGSDYLSVITQSENKAASSLERQIRPMMQMGADAQVLRLPLQDRGASGDLNCRIYSEQLGLAFLRIAQENPNVLTQPDHGLVETALKRRLPHYYVQKDNQWLQRPRSEIEQANLSLRWEMGREQLQEWISSPTLGRQL